MSWAAVGGAKRRADGAVGVHLPIERAGGSVGEGRWSDHAQKTGDRPSHAPRHHTFRMLIFSAMATYTAVIERCPETGLFVGHVPGFPGAHSQGRTLDELSQNLREVIEMLLEDGQPPSDTHFVGIQNVDIA